MDKKAILNNIKNKLNEEASCINHLVDLVDDQSYEAIKLLNNCKGRIIITGVGKSGHIGKKIAASLSSLGLPSFFVHSCEAMHGDLGMFMKGDVAILISNSGKTNEVLGMMPSLKIIGVKTIAITNNNDSPLAVQCDIQLCVKVEREIDNLNLAPTSSTLAVLAMGDAIAVTLSEMRGFKKENFALFHPAGALGQKLLAEYQKSVNRSRA